MNQWQKKISGILLWLCIFAVTGSVIYLVDFYHEYGAAKKEYTVLQEAVKTVDNGKEAGDKAITGDNSIHIDETALKKQNKDYRAWIVVEDTPIDYPVVQGADNEYYLSHTFSRQENCAGAIFLDAGNDGFRDNNTVLFGHNMRNQTMFGSLQRFQDEAFYRKHRSIQIICHGKTTEYKIFYAAILELEQAEQRMAADFKPREKDYKGGRVLTLATCSGNDSYRFLVQAELR